MTDKQLRRLTRIELLEMLIQHSKEITRLQEELDEAHELLENKYIAIDNAGSIAEASLQLNGVFNAAQQAADQYLHNVSRKQPDEDNLPLPTKAQSAAVEAEMPDLDTPSISENPPASESIDAAPVAADSDADESIAEAQVQADDIIAQAQAKADEMIAAAQAECDEMISKAREESQSWWAETSKKMDAFYKERVGLREMLAEQYKSSDQE